MKKNYIFTVYAIVLAIFFILNGAFAVGTVNTPRTYWLAAVKEADGEIEDSYFTLEFDLSHTALDEDGEEVTKYYGISEIYVFIGKVYSANADGEVKITFDFKSKSSSETTYVKRKYAKATKFYQWEKIYDGKEDEVIKELRKVKIHSPHTFELCEAAFISEDGTLIKVEGLGLQSDGTKSSASHVFDEQSTFNPSTAYAYTPTDEERAEIEAADGLFTGGESLGKAPLTTILNGIALLIFGRNTFGVRFFSYLAGYLSLIILYLLIKRLFANEFAALFGSAFALLGCALLSGGVSASGIVSLPFILLSYYSAIGFYAERYKFSPAWAAKRNLLLTGVFAGLAVSCGAYNILALLGVPVIWVLSLIKLRLKYKKDYETAKGLEKEDVYTAYQNKINACAWLLPVSFILLPVVLALISYAVTYKSLAANYGGFLSGVAQSVKNSFKASGDISGLGVFVGYGSEKAGSGYKLINYIPHCVALSGFLFTTLTAVLYKTEKFGKVWRKIRNKYKIITVAAAFTYLPLLLGINLTVPATAAFSCFYVLYILLGIYALENALGKKYTYLTAIIAGVSLVAFAGCCFGIFGFEIPSAAKNILYVWQI